MTRNLVNSSSYPVNLEFKLTKHIYSIQNNPKTFKIDPNLLTNIQTHFTEPHTTSSSINFLDKTIKQVTKIISRHIKQKNNKQVQKKIKRIINDPDFNTKIAFKLIKHPVDNNKLFYIIDRSDPMNPKINAEEPYVKQETRKHFQKMFSKKSERRDISFFLQHTPKLKEANQATTSIFQKRT